LQQKQKSEGKKSVKKSAFFRIVDFSFYHKLERVSANLAIENGQCGKAL
jgi:hypothetical protein